MTNAEYLLRFHRFQKSREIFFAPKINAALNTQYKQFTLNISHGLKALDLIDPMPIVRVIRNIYMDAGITYGAKVRADLKAKRHEQKARMPIGFSERMAELIAEYFKQDIFDTSNGITETTKELIKQVFTESYQLGLGIDDLVKKLENTELSRIRARMIARTETVTAANRGGYFVAKDSGLTLNKVWLSAKDHRVRHDHRQINGNTVGMEDYFVVGGYEMFVPGDRGGKNDKPLVPAKEVVNCRCTTLYKKAEGVAPIRTQGFTAAKTIKEAEDFARARFIKPERIDYVNRNNADDRYKKIVDVSYKGMNLEAANKINQRLLKETEETGAPLLNRIQARPIKKQGWAARMSQNGDLEINTMAFKNVDKIPDKETIEEFIKIRPYLETLREQGRLTPQHLAMLKRSDEILKYKSTVASDTPIDIITHEIGHHIDNNIKSIADKKGIDKDQVALLLKEAIKDSNIDENKYNLSYYAFSSIFSQRAEVFAEAYTLYRQNKLSRLTPSFINLFNLLTK